MEDEIKMNKAVLTIYSPDSPSPRSKSITLMMYVMLQIFKRLPVGVATMIPSPCTVVRYCWSHSKSMMARKGEGPLSITISFKMWNDPTDKETYRQR
jgi:hypothetical protein